MANIVFPFNDVDNTELFEFISGNNVLPRTSYENRYYCASNISDRYNIDTDPDQLNSMHLSSYPSLYYDTTDLPIFFFFYLQVTENGDLHSQPGK